MMTNVLREAALTRPAIEHPESACMTDETLLAFAEGGLTDSDRLAWTPHLARCRRCQHEIASLVRALNDPDVIRAARVDRSYRSLSSATIMSVIAAAAAIMFVIALPRDHNWRTPPGQHREPVLTPALAPVIDGPIGTVSTVDALRWSAVPHADAYRVTLFDVDGRVLFEGDAVEPRLALPDSLKLVPEKRYLWQVQARIGFDRWVSSDLVEFRVISQSP